MKITKIIILLIPLILISSCMKPPVCPTLAPIHRTVLCPTKTVFMCWPVGPEKLECGMVKVFDEDSIYSELAKKRECTYDDGI